MRRARLLRMYAMGLGGMVIAAPAVADWLAFEVNAVGTAPVATVGTIEAVDSWFTTLATLMFEIDGLQPGTYDIVMLEQADCVHPGEGTIYRRVGDAATVPAGALGEFVVGADGATTRTLSVKPEYLQLDTERLTVTEMRGHALVFRTAAAEPVACGAIPAMTPDEAGAAGVD